MTSSPRVKGPARFVIVAVVLLGAAVVWFFAGPVQDSYGSPDGAWWVVAGPVCLRPGWEDSTYLLLSPPSVLRLGLWSAHAAAAWVLQRAGFIRRGWLVFVGPAILGQGLLMIAFHATFSRQL